MIRKKKFLIKDYIQNVIIYDFADSQGDIGNEMFYNEYFLAGKYAVLAYLYLPGMLTWHTGSNITIIDIENSTIPFSLVSDDHYHFIGGQ
jgi:hypothetical protein